MSEEESNSSESAASSGLTTFLRKILVDKGEVIKAYYSKNDHDSVITTWIPGSRKIKQHPRHSQLSQIGTLIRNKWYVKPDTNEAFLDKATAAVTLANKHRITTDRMVDMGGLRKDYPLEGVLIPLDQVAKCRCCFRTMNCMKVVDGQVVSNRVGWTMDVVWDKKHNGTDVYDILYDNEQSYVHASVMFGHAHIHRWYYNRISTQFGELYEFEYRVYTSLRSVLRTLLIGRGKLERFFELPIPMIRTYRQCSPFVQRMWMWYSAIVYTAAYPSDLPVKVVTRYVTDNKGDFVMNAEHLPKTYTTKELDIGELDIYVSKYDIPPKIKELIMKHMHEEIFMCNKRWMDAVSDVSYPFFVRQYTEKAELIDFQLEGGDWY
jgi:hypothetical protein